jgi:hypothetical protein
MLHLVRCEPRPLVPEKKADPSPGGIGPDPDEGLVERQGGKILPRLGRRGEDDLEVGNGFGQAAWTAVLSAWTPTRLTPTRRRSRNPVFAMARATRPMFSEFTGRARMTEITGVLYI